MDETTRSLFVVATDETLEGAMAAIDNNRHRSVIVVDSDSRVVGTLSDGDVRKAILHRRVLSTPVAQVMNTNFLYLAAPDAERARQIFDTEHVFLIPVLDGAGRLLEILTAY